MSVGSIKAASSGGDVADLDVVLAGLLDGQSHATCESCRSVMRQAWELLVGRSGPYRTGRKLGRTVYRADDDILIGVMDTPELGAMVVDALNRTGAPCCPECGGPYDRGCGARFHDTAPPAPDDYDPVGDRVRESWRLAPATRFALEALAAVPEGWAPPTTVELAVQCNPVEVPKQRIAAALAVLLRRGHVERLGTAADGGRCWAITDAGRSALREETRRG